MNEPSPELIAVAEKCARRHVMGDNPEAGLFAGPRTHRAVFELKHIILSELQPVVDEIKDRERTAINILRSNLDRDIDQKDTLNSLVVTAVNALHYARKEHDQLKHRAEQSEQKLCEVVRLIDSGIDGKKLPVYLEEQFPASIGHLPLVEYDQRIRKALSSTQPKEGEQ